jgi:hypothetical protein
MGSEFPCVRTSGEAGAALRLDAESGRGQLREPLQRAIAIFEKTSAEYDLGRARQLGRVLEQDSRDLDSADESV